MNIELKREALLQPLQQVIGVVERRQTLPILSHVLIQVTGQHLSLTVTDLEVELIANQSLEVSHQPQQVTLPGRKLMEICRSLPDNALIKLSFEQNQVVLRSGKSRFTLSTLSVEDFPKFDQGVNKTEFSLASHDLRYLLEHTYFAMAQEDVRYYLNGLFWKLNAQELVSVASDGHRLACVSKQALREVVESSQCIIPRKCIAELLRLIEGGDVAISVAFGESHIIFSCENFVLTSKLIEGQFPDHRQLIPRQGNMSFIAEKRLLKQVLSRTSILSNEKIRGIRMELSFNKLRVIATNPEHEEAEDEIAVDYSADNFVIGFNVGYILDVLSIIDSEHVKFSFVNVDSGVLIESLDDDNVLYVVMPMRF